MKTIIITASVFLVMMIGTLGYVIGLSQGLDTTIDGFKNGQTLCGEYQLDIDSSGTTIYDGERLVSFLTKDTTQRFDSLIFLVDNQ